MLICGLQKLSMVDYPGRIAATVFTGGCDLRCPFCHNALLVTRLEESPRIDRQEVLSFLASRRGLLDGVVISGGEPLLQKDIIPFICAVRDLGFPVKLDTNGFHPDVLRALLDGELLDYVAMDIKNCREKYALTTGIQSPDLGAVEESIALLRSGQIPYEFRTTVVREFHTAEDILAISRWLSGSRAYYLQNFNDSGNLIRSGLHGHSPEEMDALLQIALPHFQTAALRGI